MNPSCEFVSVSIGRSPFRCFTARHSRRSAWGSVLIGCLLVFASKSFAQNRNGAAFQIVGNVGWELSSTETSREATAKVFIDRILYPKFIPGGRMPVITLIATKSDPRTFVNGNGGSYKYFELFYGTDKVVS